jgi:hypothetical protein
MGNTASIPPHADVQSGGKKDTSYVDCSEANATSMATTICIYLSQPPLGRTSRLSRENSGGVPLLWACTSVASASEAMLVEEQEVNGGGSPEYRHTFDLQRKIERLQTWSRF